MRNFAAVRERSRKVLKGVLPRRVRFVLRHLYRCWQDRAQLHRSLGATDAIRFVWVPVGYELGAGWWPRLSSRYLLASPRATHPIELRRATSDIDVFRQIFVEQEYLFMDDVTDARAIVDCGANIGCASIWFLTTHPQSRVVAIEPEPANRALLSRNLAAYGDRAVTIEGALWDRQAQLVIVRGEFGDGREWATQVRECRESEPPDLIGYDMSQAFAPHGAAPIDILKVDIEGSERIVFRRSDSSWISRVRNVIIELHSQEDRAVVEAALPAVVFEQRRWGELTAYLRRDAIVKV